MNGTERFDQKFTVVWSIKNSKHGIPHAFAGFYKEVSNTSLRSNIARLNKVRDTSME